MRTNFSRHSLITLVIVLWVFQSVGTIEAQRPGSAQTQPAKPTFCVTGTVVSATDGVPLARAHIVLASTKDRQQFQLAASSEDGHFEFNQVEKGKYSLEGAKRGFISQAYNQHEDYSTAIVTGADVPTEGLVLRLVPAAVLSVRIIDESAEPVRNASVMLYREDHRSGIRRVGAFRNGSTDDLGSCEFARLVPDTYFVGVTVKLWYALRPPSLPEKGQGNSSESEVRSFDVVYPPTYYGDTTETDSATPIAIKGGNHIQAEIHLSPVPALRVVFRAENSPQNGFTAPSLQKLGLDGTEIPQMTETQNVSPGLFEITGIAPGRYKVSLPGSTPGEMDIASNGQDLSEAKGEALGTLKASVQVLGETKLPQPLYVRLHNKDGKSTGVQEKVDEKGDVTFTNVSPGQYNLSAGSFVKNYPVVKVTSQSGETSAHSLNLTPGSSLTASLTLVANAVNVEGYAKRAGKGAAGAMVVLVPKNPESNRELFRRDQSDLDGSFTLQGIAPGSYTVVAIEDGWNLDWALPSVIEPYLKNGQTVMIRDDLKHLRQLPDAVEVQPDR